MSRGRSASVVLYLALAAAGCSNGSAGESTQRTTSALTTIQRQKLFASDPGAFDRFGTVLSLSRDTLVVGTPEDDSPGLLNTGSVYVLVRTGSGFVESQKLTPTDRASFGRFGGVLALDGDTLLVGAGEGTGVPLQTHVVHVFERSQGAFVHRQRLVAPDSSEAGDFGLAIAIFEGRAAIVTASSVYVFAKNPSGWEATQRIAKPAGSLAMSSDLLLVGSACGAGSCQGSVTAFERDGETWTERQVLGPSTGGSTDLFGYQLALSGSTALVSAPGVSAGRGA